MHQDKTTYYQCFVLDYWKGPAVNTDQATEHSFVLRELSGEQRREHFNSLEQVMNFLLDELLGEWGKK